VPQRVLCPECQTPMKLIKGPWSYFYGCTKYPECTGKLGAHPDGKPMGTPASQATRTLRIQAHNRFDLLWMKNSFVPGSGTMSREQAYWWMQQAMELSEEAAHIGKFDGEQCTKLIKLVDEFLAAEAEGP
jgi:ssDNA-binding Zn-finger/Zn-ribbon topoisomerase 1